MLQNVKARVTTALLAGVLATASSDAQVELTGDDNFSTGFEESEGYSAGYLESDPDWTISGTAFPLIGSFGYDGTFGVEMGGDTGLAIDFFSSQSAMVGWVDFRVKPAFAGGEDLPTDFELGQAALTGFVKVGASGEVYALHGDGSGNGVWMDTGYFVLVTDGQADDWLRMTYRLDYGSQRWDLYLDDSLQMIDLGFVDANAPPLSGFSIEGSTEGETYFDQFEAGFFNPLFLDSDNDGVPDAYEQEQGLDYSLNDREGDRDNDGIANILEYMRGLQAGDGDSDGDGVHDGAEITSGADPTVADAYALNDVPFIEDFESHATGSIDGQGLWQLEGGQAVVQTATVSEGAQALQFEAGETSVELSNAFDGSDSLTVWMDFRIQPIRFNEDAELTAELIAENTSVAFCFLEDNQIAVFHGNSSGEGEWRVHEHAASLTDWQRVTILKDYENQSFSIRVNGPVVADNVGFAWKQPYFNRFSLKQGEQEAAYLDDLQISFEKPAGLDSDGDGLADELEDLNGNGIVDPGETDPLLADTDGDGFPDSAPFRLRLWLTADQGVETDGSGYLTAWRDQSIYREDALSSATDSAPQLLSADPEHGLPTVQFDGANDMLLGDTGFDATGFDYTIFVVQRRSGGHDWASLLSYAWQSSGAPVLRWGRADDSVGIDKGEGEGPGIKAYLGTGSDDLTILTASHSGGDATGLGGDISVWALGEEVATVASGTQDWSGSVPGHFLLGAVKNGTDKYFGGTISEVLVYDAALTEADRLEVESYLAYKYGVPLDRNYNEIEDIWEEAHFGRLLEASEELQDHDGDGLNALREYHLGLDPKEIDNLGFPQNHPSLKLWLSADTAATVDDSSQLLEWGDLSGNGVAAITGDGANPPSLSPTGFNGRAAVTFDGSQALTADVDYDLSAGDYTIVAVHAGNASTGDDTIISFRRENAQKGAPNLSWQSGTKLGATPNAETGTPIVATVGSFDGGIGYITSLTRADGTLATSSSGFLGAFSETAAQDWTSAASTGLHIGQEKPAGDKKLSGSVAEILVFDQTLTDRELSELNAYLSEKYGISDDVDSDGLLNVEEDVNLNGVVDAGESSPFSEDTDGDGIPDLIDSSWTADPVADASALQNQTDGSKALRFGFEHTEGYEPGRLDGQLGWEASQIIAVDGTIGAEGTAQSLLSTAHQYEDQFAYAKHYLSAPDEPIVWVTFRAKLKPVELPDPASVDSRVGAVFAMNYTNRLAVFDAVQSQWVTATETIDDEAWVRYDVKLDYANKEWKLCVEGVTMFDSVPFVDPSRDSLSRFELLQQGGSGTLSWIDEIVIRNVEPEGLDFDGDGLDNATERQLGSDPFSVDTDGDGMDDAYEYANGLDILNDDASGDLDGDGASNIAEYTFGTDPQLADIDGADGIVRRYVWTNRSGGKVENLTSLPDFPLSPDRHSLADSLDFPQSENFGGNYGQRIYGLIVAPETADYIFWIAGNDSSEFWLSTNESPSDRERVAYVDGGVNYQSWNSRIGQRSVPISLTAGQAYYFEILHKEGSGPGHVSVSWQYAAEPQHVITGNHLRAHTLATDDQDQDGFSDAWEIANGLDETKGYGDNGYAGDLDGDGILNYREREFGTRVDLADTDGDGYSDSEEVRHFHSDPTVADLDATPVVVGTLDGAAHTSSRGAWATEGSELYAVDSTGSVGYTLSFAEAGAYRIVVEIAEQNAYKKGTSTFELRGSLDGVNYGIRSAKVDYGATAEISYYLPYLPGGDYEFVLDWLNGFGDSFLRVKSIRVEEINGVDEDQDGVADWVENRATLNGSDEALPLEIYTSPFCFEGTSFAPSAVAITSHPVSDSTNLREESVRQALYNSYYADVALRADEDRVVLVDDQSGLRTSQHTLTWAAFNAVVHDFFHIRLNDSMLLTAIDETLSQERAIELQLTAPDGTVKAYPLAAGARLQALFDQDGDWQLQATLLPLEDEDPAVYDSVIRVSSASLDPEPIIFDNRARMWTPAISDAEVEVQSDNGIFLYEENPGSMPRTFMLNSRIAGGRLISRLPNGQILSTTESRVIRDYSRSQPYNKIVETYADGTVMVSAYMILNEVPEGLSVNINIWKSGVTFDDGTNSRTVTADDFDEQGRYRFYLLRAPGVDGGNCYSYTFKQDDTVVSSW